LSVAAAGGVEMSFAAAGLIGIAVAVLVLTGMPRRSIRRYDHQSLQAKPTAGGSRLAVITPTVLSLTMLFVLLNLNTSGIQNFSVAALVAGYGVELSLANVALTSFLFASAFGVLAGGAVADRTSRHGIWQSLLSSAPC
jgi:MFS transporter, FSR family, fosmidomycin resistance protein